MPQPLSSESDKGARGSIKKTITRACDSCRRKKIRCEPISDHCVQCVKSNTRCHFTPISVLISRRRMTRDKRVEELEKRLAGLENQLRLPMEERSTPNDTASDSSSSLQDAAGFNSYRHIQNPVQRHLPPRDSALRMVTIYFQGPNTVHPIFDQDTFMSRFNSEYGVDCSDTDPGWWAALNVVFAIANQYWDVPDLNPEEDLEAWRYFQNAFDATNKLIMGHYTLASVQALLGIAMIKMAMPHQKPSTLIISSAIKIAHQLGLNRQHPDPKLSAIEVAERRRVFWVAYSLDKDISLQTKQPPTQNDDDMDIEPPSEIDYDPVQPVGVHHDLFYFRTRLSLIQSQIYRRLLSLSAGKQSLQDRAIAAQDLEMTLQTWRKSLPVELFSDHAGEVLKRGPSQTSPRPIYLQLAYFQALAVIQESFPSLPWEREIQSSQIRIHIYSATVAYPEEARSAMKLFSITPRKKLACVWTTLHVFITAATTLLSHIISEPSNSLAKLDLKLLEPFLYLLGVVSKSGGTYQVEETYRSHMSLFEQAKVAVGRPRLRETPHQIKGVAKESIEDFLRRIDQMSSGDGDGDGSSLISQEPLLLSEGFTHQI